MVREDDSSEYSSDDSLELPITDKLVPSSSLKRKHDDVISEKGLTFRRIMQHKTPILAENESECTSNVKRGQSNVLVSNKPLSFAKHEQVNNNKSIKIGQKCKSVVNGEKEKRHEDMVNVVKDQKSKGDGVDEFCTLHEVLEMGTLFQSLDGYEKKLLVQNLKKLGAQERKELTDEWKGLLVEELRLKIKKQSFSTKLANAGLSS